MSDFCTASTFLAPHSRFPAIGPAQRHVPVLEEALARVLGVVGRCARIAWWDGSAIGLRLNGFIGLFGVADWDVEAERREPQA